MPRTIREDFPGAWHHVMNRGRNRERIYLDDVDAVAFLFTLHTAIERFGIEIHAYSLMPNHYHLLVRSPLGNLSSAMKHIGSTYTLAFNKRHKKDGTLFRGRFKNQLVKYEAYLAYLFAYLHLNPLRAGLITRLDALSAWTSYRRLMGRDSDPEWLSMDGMKSAFGSAEAMKELTLRLHRKAQPWPEGMKLDDGSFQWHLCPQDPSTPGSVANDGVPISSILEDICEMVGVAEPRLRESVYGPGGNPERRFAAWVLHRGTYLTYRQIGEQLAMTPRQVAKNIERCKKDLDSFAAWLDEWNRRYPTKVSSVNT